MAVPETDGDDMDKITEAVRAHEAAMREAAEAEVRRDDAIREALADGVSVAHLVELTGLTRARIYQIRDRRR